MSRRRPGTLRIGELAAQTGLTPATIRYYEQIGLLPGGPRPSRSHRIYTESDVDRLELLRRLRDLLGVSLEELKAIAAAEEKAASLPARVRASSSVADKLRLVDEALREADGVLHLVRARAIDLRELEDELADRRHRIQATRITDS